MIVSFNNASYDFQITDREGKLSADVVDKRTSRKLAPFSVLLPTETTSSKPPIEFVAELLQSGYTLEIQDQMVRLRKVTASKRSSSLYMLRDWTKEVKEARTFEGNLKGVSTLMQLRNGDILSGSFDYTIKQWDLATGKCYNTFKEHTGIIYAMCELDNNTMASGSGDGTIKLWNVKTGECLHTLRGHTADVTSLTLLDQNLLVSGSLDRNIRLWNLKTKQCDRIIDGHSDKVSTLMTLKNGQFASGSSDHTIRIWDPKTGECVMTLHGHTGGVRALIELPEDIIVSGSNDKTIKLWNLKTQKCFRTLTQHDNAVLALIRLQDDTIVSGSSDHTIKLWDSKKWIVLHTLRGHLQNVNALTVLQDGCFASGAWTEIKLWEGEALVEEGPSSSSNALNLQPNQMREQILTAVDAAMLKRLQQLELQHKEQFSDLLQKQAATFQRLLEEKQTPSNTDKSMQQMQIFRTTFNQALQEQSAALVNTTEAQLQTLKKSIEKKVNTQLINEIKSYLKSEDYQKQIQEFQGELLYEISLRQNKLDQEMIETQVSLEAEQVKTSILFQRYDAKRQKLAEQQSLQKPDSVRAFYNTLEKCFSAKIMGAMVLVSGMIVREETKLESRAQMASKVVGFLLGSVPVVGDVVCFAIEKGAEIAASRSEERKYNNSFDSALRFKDAMTLAELAARRATQAYIDILKSINVEEAASSGEKAADAMIDFLQAGNLKDLANNPVEERIAALIKAVQVVARQDKGLLSVKGAIFPKPVSPAKIRHIDDKANNALAKADQNEIELQRQKLRAQQKEREREAFNPIVADVFISTERGKAEALKRLKAKGKISECKFNITQSNSDKTITIEIRESQVAVPKEATLNISLWLTSIFHTDIIVNTFEKDTSVLIIPRSSTVAPYLFDVLKEWLGAM